MRPCRLLLPLLGLATAGLAAPEPATLAAAITTGTVTLQVRARWEHVNQAGLRAADALTLRPRLGYVTAPWHGWQATLEGEATAALDGDRYNQAGLNPGGAGRAVVADPTSSGLNQALVTYRAASTTLTLGRQRLVLDNARFIGDVGWRQDQQTFDALTLVHRPAAALTLTGGWLARVHRVFGHRHPQGEWDADAPLLHVRYTGLAAGALTGYAYLLDLPGAPAQSCATYGVSLAGSRPVGRDLHLDYRAEVATQRDHGPNPRRYAADYGRIELDLRAAQGALGAGHEVLGTDGGSAFRTPLATLHAFNGWADAFLTTPAAGLRDTWVKAAAPLPGDLRLEARYHRFTSAGGGTRYGAELDLQLTRRFGKRLTATAKSADFRANEPGRPDVRKFWLQLDYTL